MKMKMDWRTKRWKPICFNIHKKCYVPECRSRRHFRDLQLAVGRQPLTVSLMQYDIHASGDDDDDDDGVVVVVEQHLY